MRCIEGIPPTTKYLFNISLVSLANSFTDRVPLPTEIVRASQDLSLTVIRTLWGSLASHMCRLRYADRFTALRLLKCIVDMAGLLGQHFPVTVSITFDLRLWYPSIISIPPSLKMELSGVSNSSCGASISYCSAHISFTRNKYGTPRTVERATVSETP